MEERSHKFILEGRMPVPCTDTLAWAKWFENADRQVAEDIIDNVCVSTVFIGLDHNWSLKGPPILFETKIFGGAHDGYQRRFATWEQAEHGHMRAVALVRLTLGP